MNSQRPGYRLASPRPPWPCAFARGSWVLQSCRARAPASTSLRGGHRGLRGGHRGLRLRGSSLHPPVPSRAGDRSTLQHPVLTVGSLAPPSLLSGSSRRRLLPHFGTAPIRACIHHRERRPGSRGESADKVVRGDPPSLLLVFCYLAVTSALHSLPSLPPSLSPALSPDRYKRYNPKRSCNKLPAAEHPGEYQIGGMIYENSAREESGGSLLSRGRDESHVARDAGSHRRSRSIAGTFAPG